MSKETCDGSSNSSLKEHHDPEIDPERVLSKIPSRGLWFHLNAEVDTDKVTAPLAVFSFMAGFLCVIPHDISTCCYSTSVASSTHTVAPSRSQPFLCGVDFRQATSFRCDSIPPPFSTRSSHVTPSKQLSLAIARLFSSTPGNRTTVFQLPDQQALTSLISFNLGASLGRIGDKIGALTRLWLVLGTLFQALLTMMASIAIWKSGELSIASSREEPTWTNFLSFICIAFMSASLGLQGVMSRRLGTSFSTTSLS